MRISRFRRFRAPNVKVYNLQILIYQKYAYIHAHVSLLVKRPWITYLRNATSRLCETNTDHALSALSISQEYLKRFDRYIDFLNLDVERYMASMTHTGPAAGGDNDDDDNDGEGGLGLPSVDIAALRSVLQKHRVRHKWEGVIAADCPVALDGFCWGIGFVIYRKISKC